MPEAPRSGPAGDAGSDSGLILQQVSQGRIRPVDAVLRFEKVLERRNVRPGARRELTRKFGDDLARATRRWLSRRSTVETLPQPGQTRPARRPEQSRVRTRDTRLHGTPTPGGASSLIGDVAPEFRESPLLRVAREGKSDRREPPSGIIAQLASKLREIEAGLNEDLGSGKSVADAREEVAGSIDNLLRQTLSDDLTDGRDDTNAAFEEGYRRFQNWLFGQIDRIGRREGYTDQRIADLKTIAGGAIAAVSIIGPGRRPGSVKTDRADEVEKSFGRKAASDPEQLPSLFDQGLPVVEVKTEKLRSSNAIKGTPEWDMLNDPKPNTIYKLDNGETFGTNAFGQVEVFEFAPSLDKRGRDHRQTKKGKEGLEGDVGGHLRACALGGSCDDYNLFSQDAKINNGAYKAWEKMIRDNVDDIEVVRITLIRLDPSKPRPDRLMVEWISDGVSIKRKFDNNSGGG